MINQYLKQREEEFEKEFYTRMGQDYFLDNGYYFAPDMKLGDKIKQFQKDTKY